MSNWGGARRERTSAGGGEPPEEGQICQGGAHGISKAWVNQQPACLGDQARPISTRLVLTTER